MLIQDGTHTPESLVVGTERYSAGWSSIMKFHQRSNGQRTRERRMDLLLHGWRDSHERLRLQRSVPDSSCSGARDQSREARELQLFRDYSNETAITSGFALHEPGRSRQTHCRGVEAFTMHPRCQQEFHFVRLSGYTTNLRRFAANRCSPAKPSRLGKTKADHVPNRSHPVNQHRTLRVMSGQLLHQGANTYGSGNLSNTSERIRNFHNHSNF